MLPSFYYFFALTQFSPPSPQISTVGSQCRPVEAQRSGQAERVRTSELCDSHSEKVRGEKEKRGWHSHAHVGPFLAGRLLHTPILLFFITCEDLASVLTIVSASTLLLLVLLAPQGEDTSKPQGFTAPARHWILCCVVWFGLSLCCHCGAMGSFFSLITGSH